MQHSKIMLENNMKPHSLCVAKKCVLVTAHRISYLIIQLLSKWTLHDFIFFEHSVILL